MMTSMLTDERNLEGVGKFYCALKSAQQDIELRPELYTHYYLKELPQVLHALVDVRAMGPGERIVFEPYTREVFESSREWIAEHEIISAEELWLGKYLYESSTVSLSI